MLVKIGIPLLFVCSVIYLGVYLPSFFGLSYTSFGQFNAAVIAIILISFFIDLFFSRQVFYSLFWWLLVEPPVLHSFRFFRKIVFITFILAGLIGFVFTIGSPDQISSIRQTENNFTDVLTVSIGIYLSAIGWIYNANEAAQNNRRVNTLTAINTHLYSDHGARVYKDYIETRDSIWNKVEGTKDKALPLSIFTQESGKIYYIDDNGVRCNILPRRAAIRYLNALDHLALGVRYGEFDFDSVAKIGRLKMITAARNLSEFIEDRCKAEPVSLDGTNKKRSTNRKWEHFLWLVYQFQKKEKNMHEVDQKIVLPKTIRDTDRSKFYSSFLSYILDSSKNKLKALL